MAKSNKEKEGKDPFQGFKLLKGEFETPVEVDETNETETIETIDEINDNKTETKKPSKEELEAANKKKADEMLEIVAEKQRKSLSKKNQELEEDEVIEGDNTETEETDESVFKMFAKNLYTKGVVDVDDTDPDFEDSEEGIETLVGKTVDNRINQWVNQLPDDFKKLLEYTNNGGNPKDFLHVYYGNHSWLDFKVDSEANQKAVIAESLRLQDYSTEEINDIIEEYTDNGSLEKRAKTALPKLQKLEEKQKEEILDIQKRQAERTKELELEYYNNFKKDLESKDNIKGFKLTPKIKTDLWSFMTTVNKKTGKTQYQEAIENDREASLLFALQAMSNFDVQKLEKQVLNKTTSQIASKLRNDAKTTKEKISSGGTETIETKNPFSGFKTIG